jgi:hypothetical protein
VEPWADEYGLPSGHECEIIATHAERLPTFLLDSQDHRILVWIGSGSEGGGACEFWLDGEPYD